MGKIKGKTLTIIIATAAAVLVIVGIVCVRMSGTEEIYRNVKVLETEETDSLARGDDEEEDEDVAEDNGEDAADEAGENEEEETEDETLESSARRPSNAAVRSTVSSDTAVGSSAGTAAGTSGGTSASDETGTNDETGASEETGTNDEAGANDETGTNDETDANDEAGTNDETGTSVALTSDDFFVDISDQVYTGSTIEPTVTLLNSTLTAEDYVVSYSENTGVGTATITITGSGNYTGTLTYTFTITKQSVEIPTIESLIYNGEYQTAVISDSDLYEVNDKEGGTDAGAYTVKLKLTDSANYQWSDGSEEEIIQLKFVIEPREVTLEWTAPESLVYDGFAKIPSVTLGNVLEGDSINKTVKLSDGYTDGTDNVNAGHSFSYTVTELDDDNYCLPSDATSPIYTITAREISSSDFTLSAVDGEDGIVVTVSPVPQAMVEGKDYVWSYYNYMLTITGMGNCTGTLSFSIKEEPEGFVFVQNNH